jgi:hypothetical protein
MHIFLLKALNVMLSPNVGIGNVSVYLHDSFSTKVNLCLVFQNTVLLLSTISGLGAAICKAVAVAR